jgi:DNA replication initiation complex subunit (GINS family)
LEYEEIFKLWKAQKDSSSLLEIPADFYISMDGKLAKLYENSQHQEWPELVEKVIERMEFLRKDLAKLRLFRIVNSIIFNIPIDEKLLTWSERRIIKDLQKSIETLGISDISISDSPNIFHTQNISPTMDLSGDSEALDNQIEEINDYKLISPKNLMIRMLDNVEAFVGLDNKEYGPLIKNEIVFLPVENAKVLIAKALARVIETSKKDNYE